MPKVLVDRRGIVLGVCMCLLLGVGLVFGLMYKWDWGLGKSHVTMILGLIFGAGTVGLMFVVFLFHIFYRCPTCRMQLRRKEDRYHCPRCQVVWVTGWSENPPPP